MNQIFNFICIVLLLFPVYSLQSQPEVEFYMDNIFVEQGSSFEVPVYVRNFKKINGVQFSIKWDSMQLRLDTITDFGFSGLTLNSFGTSNFDKGEIGMAWAELSQVEIQDGEILFKLHFKAIGDCLSETQINFTDEPTFKLVNRIEGVDILTVPASYIDAQAVNYCSFSNDSIAVKHVDCFGEKTGRIEAFVSGGIKPYRYEWSTGASSSNISDLPAGNYALTITDSLDNRIEISSLEILQNPSLELNIGNDTTLCGEDDFTLNGGLGYENYSWYLDGILVATGISHLTATGSGVYTLAVMDTLGCEIQDTINLILGILPNFDLGTDQEICEGDSVSLQANCSSCISYSWSTGESSSSISVEASGNYLLTGINSDGCEFTDEIIITSRPVPVFSLGQDSILCRGEKITIGTDMAAASYLWSSGGLSSNISVENSGEYVLTALNDFGCEFSDTIALDFLEPFDVFAEAFPPVVCPGDTIQFEASGGDEVFWYSDAGTLISQDFLFDSSIETGGTYQVIGVDRCFSDTANLNYDVFEINADAGSDTCLILGNSLNLNAVGGINYQWKGDGSIDSSLDIPNPEVSPTDSSWFYVSIIDQNQCKTLDSVFIAVLDSPLNLIRPVNIITPNGDGDNDFLKFDGLNKYQNNQLTVFNRWGNVVYDKIKYENDWNGIYKNSELPEGSYFYVLRVNNMEIKSSLIILKN